MKNPLTEVQKLLHDAKETALVVYLNSAGKDVEERVKFAQMEVDAAIKQCETQRKRAENGLENIIVHQEK